MVETKLVWFNALEITRALLATGKSLPSWAEYYNYKDSSEQHIFKLLDTGISSASCLVDRQGTGSIHQLAIVDHMRIPELTTMLTWDEITYNRVKEIESYLSNTGSRLVVRYSGGLDSTYIVCALIKYASKDLLDNTIIMLSTDSVIENPYFYKEVLVKTFKHFLNNKDQVNHSLSDAVYVTGKLGDKILSSDTGLKWIWENKDKSKYHYTRCKDSIVNDFYRYLHSYNAAAQYYEIIDNSIKQSNLPIVTVYDFYWWFSFNYAWVDYSYGTDYFDTAGNKRTNNFPWFDTQEFQQWAMHNVGSNLKFDLDTHDEKKVLKDFIFEIDKNEFDRKFKIKYRSNDAIGTTSKHSFKLAVDANESAILSDRNTILADAMRLGLIPVQ